MQDRYSLLIPKTLIPNNSDLNDYTTPGSYYTPNAAASQTMQNCPYTGSGFKLIVEKLSSNSHILQTLKGVNSKFVYYRTASDSDFRDWFTPVTNADLELLNGAQRIQADYANQTAYYKVINNNVVHQLAFNSDGIYYDKLDNGVWTNLWHIYK